MPRSRDLGGSGAEIARDRAICKLRSVASLSFETLRSGLRSQNCDLLPHSRLLYTAISKLRSAICKLRSRSRNLRWRSVCDLRATKVFACQNVSTIDFCEHVFATFFMLNSVFQGAALAADLITAWKSLWGGCATSRLDDGYTKFIQN